MRALTWQGKNSVSVETVPDPRIQKGTDAIVRITSTAICGSDLHLLEVLGPFMERGDVMGHEPMGVVEEVGADVTNLSVGDRVVVPFVIACGNCWYCARGLQSQCETTRVTSAGSGASLFGFSSLYGQVPGGQAEYLRVPHADYGPIVVGRELPDERYLFLSDIVPTAWQGVRYAGVPDGGALTVLGLGPVGQLAARMGVHLGYDVTAIEPESERRDMAARHGVTPFAPGDDALGEIRERTAGRGPDSVVDAVGMEAHGSPLGKLAHGVLGVLPDAVARGAAQKVGTDRTAALDTAIALVRRGGTVSLSGVYGGAVTPLPLITMFDKQIQFRMGQCNVKHWIDELLPLVEDGSDPLGLDDLVTHRVGLEDAPGAYEMFQKKTDGCIKVVLQP